MIFRVIYQFYRIYIITYRIFIKFKTQSSSCFLPFFKSMHIITREINSYFLINKKKNKNWNMSLMILCYDYKRCEKRLKIEEKKKEERRSRADKIYLSGLYYLTSIYLVSETSFSGAFFGTSSIRTPFSNLAEISSCFKLSPT